MDLAIFYAESAALASFSSEELAEPTQSARRVDDDGRARALECSDIICAVGGSLDPAPSLPTRADPNVESTHPAGSQPLQVTRMTEKEINTQTESIDSSALPQPSANDPAADCDVTVQSNDNVAYPSPNKHVDKMEDDSQDDPSPQCSFNTNQNANVSISSGSETQVILNEEVLQAEMHEEVKTIATAATKPREVSTMDTAFDAVTDQLLMQRQMDKDMAKNSRLLQETDVTLQPETQNETTKATELVVTSQTLGQETPGNHGVPSRAIHHETETSSEELKEFWTCSNCSYNVNPATENRCLHCCQEKAQCDADNRTVEKMEDIQATSYDRKSEEHLGSYDSKRNRLESGDAALVVDVSSDTQKDHLELREGRAKKKQRFEEITYESDSASSMQNRWECSEAESIVDNSDIREANQDSVKEKHQLEISYESDSVCSKDQDMEEEYNKNGSMDWTCLTCTLVNAVSEVQCTACGRRRENKMNTSKQDEQNDNIGWACERCAYLNSRDAGRCNGCYGRRGTVTNNDEITYEDHNMEEEEEEEEDDDAPEYGEIALEESGREEDEVIEKDSGWTCRKCNHHNKNSRTTCSDCRGRKDGKKPSKEVIRLPKKNGPVKKTAGTTKLPPVLNKTEYKPLFEEGDAVYAPWWISDEDRENQTWHPGAIKSYSTLKNCPYGPVRRYNIHFDDGDELNDIEDFCIFSKEDYLLSEAKKEWVGVVNILDSKSSDLWAKKVGWYEATLGIETYAFSRLYDALKAYDDYEFYNKGKRAKLNHPDKIINKGKIPKTSIRSSSKPKTEVSSKYKYVYLDKTSGLYRAVLFMNQNKHGLGSYQMKADAAWSVDRCSHELGLQAVNFTSKAQYSKARRLESRERGVNVSISDIETYMSSKVSDVLSKCSSTITTKWSSPSKEETYSIPKYKGISFIKKSKKYSASIKPRESTKKLFLGSYDVAADAAWAIDRCSHELRLTPVNFANSTEYSKSRKEEMSRRGLTIHRSELQTYMSEKISDAVSSINMNNKSMRGKVPSNKEYLPGKIKNERNVENTSPTEILDEKYKSDIAIKVEQVASRPITPNKSKLILLTSEQTDNLKFPSGTPVWWFAGNDDDDGIYNEGTIGSVFYDITSRDLLYEVVPMQRGDATFFSQMDLGYAPTSQVLISPCFDDLRSARELFDQGETLLKGSILFCKREGSDWVYTARILHEATGHMKLLENIPSNNVLYFKNK